MPTAAFAKGEGNIAPQGDTDSTNYYEIDTINENGDGGDEGNPEEGNTEGSNNGGIAEDGSVSYRSYDNYTEKWSDDSIDEDDYIVITDTDIEWDKEWYVVSSEVTIDEDVKFTAQQVHLILCDGAELIINGKLSATKKLNIYGQESGTGKLTVTSNKFDDDGNSYEIKTMALTIHGGNISATSGSTKQDDAKKAYSYGMYAGDSMYIYGGTVMAKGGNVTANSDNAMSIGIKVMGGLTVSNCSLTATAGEANSTGGAAISRGLWVSDAMTVTNSTTVTATGSISTSTSGTATSYGVDLGGNVTLDGGSLNATANKATGSSSSGSYGIYASGGLTVSGGTVKLPVGSYIGGDLKVGDEVTLADLLPDDGKKYGFKDNNKVWHGSDSTEKTLPGATVKLWPIESVSIEGAKSSYIYGEESELRPKVTQQSGVTETPTYEWLQSEDGGTGTTVGGTASTFKPGSLDARTSYTHRVKATVDDCSVTSEPVTFSVNKTTMTTEQYSAPTANTLTYNNGEQELVNAGTVPTGCTMQYKLGNGEWSSDIPKAKNAGNYTVYWKILGGTNYEDVTNTTPVQVSIAQKTVTPTVSLETSTFDYDGTAKTPAVTVMDGGATISASEYRVSYSNNINAGTAIVTDQTGGNYVIETATADFTINRATYNGDKTANGSAKYGGSNTVALRGLIMPGGTATIDTTATVDSNSVLSSYSISNDTKLLSFTFNDGSILVGNEATVKVSISGCTNYENYKITVTLTVDDKLTPTVTAPTEIENLTYNGSDQTLINAASTTGGTLQYSLDNRTWSAKLPTAKNANTYTVYYKVDGNADYADVAANSISVTIGKKAITVKPQSYTITKGNAIPAFALEYDGLVSGDSLTTSAAPTFTCYEADGNTAVSTSTVAGSYTITWTNSDAFDFTGETNYTMTKATTGTLTINNKPSGGGGGSSSNTTSSTVKNPDGSTTTTVTDKKTGTVTETTTTPTGTSSTTVTDKNGNSTTTVSVSKKDAQSGNTVTLPVGEVTAAGKSENAQEITVEVPSGGATIEVPVKNPTPGTVIVIVDKDGNETVVPTTKQTENSVSVTLTEDATIKVIENSKDFSDVRSSDYFDKAVDWAASRGITGGNSATTFGPHDSCTRAQIVTMLYRLLGQ